MRYMIGLEERHAIEIEVTGGDDCVSPLCLLPRTGVYPMRASGSARPVVPRRASHH
jgi:hypothetical protein